MEQCGSLVRFIRSRGRRERERERERGRRRGRERQAKCELVCRKENNNVMPTPQTA